MYDLDKIMEQLRARATTPTSEQLVEREDRRKEEAEIMAACFGTPAGQAALELLQRKFCSPIKFDAQIGFYEAAAIGFQRTGQEMVVNFIGQRLQDAKRGLKRKARS
jgi:hypothetical protein